MHTLNTYSAFALASMLVIATNPLVASAIVGDTAGDYVVGQPDATSSTPNVSGRNASGLSAPAAAAFDASGNLFVVDTGNHRVLGYRSPRTTDLVADIVIGQPDFNSGTYNNGGTSATSLASPYGLTVSKDGDLYVADYSNGRILEYDRPFATDTVADFVIGQPDFTTEATNEDNVSASTLFTPIDVDLDADGDLWVVDYGHNRVLKYDNPAETRDAVADLVLGQPSFDTALRDNAVVDAKSFHNPVALAIDSQQNVWVVDFVDSRVLEFDDPKRSDAVADRVLGQPSFGSRAPNYTGSVDAEGLDHPQGIGIDANDNVYVGDSFNNRVLLYTAPMATLDRIADRVIGQPDFASESPDNGGTTARTLDLPLNLAVDAAGNLAVCDYNNNRVVLVDAPTPVVTSVQVKVSRATGRAKLVVRGFGMVSGRAVVEVNGTPLSTTRYKDVVAAADSRRLVALDENFDAIVPRGVPVEITVVNAQTGGRSAPIPFTR
jgi:sugar lactone lactonase YvrE